MWLIQSSFIDHSILIHKTYVVVKNVGPSLPSTLESHYLTFGQSASSCRTVIWEKLKGRMPENMGYKTTKREMVWRPEFIEINHFWI